MRCLNLHRVALALAAALAAPLPSGAATALAPQASSVAGVTVKVTPRDMGGPTWEFEVALDTHSQDLGDDLARTAVLVASDGREVPPLEWKGAPPGGHHRAGVLRFQALQPAPNPLELRIRRAGEPSPRTFRWAR